MRAMVFLFAVVAPFLPVFLYWKATQTDEYQSGFVQFFDFIGRVFVVFPLLAFFPLVPQLRFGNVYSHIAGAVVAGLGGLLKIYSLVYMERRLERPDLPGPVNLIATGPYAIVRHPQCLGSIALTMGWFVAWGGVFSYFVMISLVVRLVLLAYAEDIHILNKKFGAEFDSYRRRTGMFVPWIGR